MHFDLASLGDPALRLAAALLLGCAIGFERQWNQKMAGLRTNALVAKTKLATPTAVLDKSAL